MEGKAGPIRRDTFYETLFDQIPAGIVIQGLDGKIIRVNRAFCDIFGYSMDEVIGHDLDEIVVQDAGLEAEARKISENVIRGESFSIETERTRKDGTRFPVSIRGVPIIEEGRIVAAFGIYDDISERKKAEDSLATERNYFENLFMNSPAAVALVDVSGVIQRINTSFEELFGYLQHECAGIPIDDLIASGEMMEDAASLTREVAEGSRIKAERRRRKKDGTWVDVQIIAVPFPGIAGQKVVYAIYQDITERKLFEEHARYVGYHDSLTGLYNQAFIEEEIRRLDVPRQLPISVVMADLDNLKLVNDAFGHMEGDRLIIKAGNILQSCSRREDIVARCGGDEFMLLLPGTAMQDAKTICGRIRKDCASQRGNFISLSLAIGVAAKEDVTQDFANVLKKADDDMYRDKLLRSGKSRKAIFRRIEEFLGSDLRRRAHIERLKELAVLFGKFLLMSDDEMAKLDLLARFHDVGLMSVPDEILYRKGPLGIGEMEIIRKHPERGYRIAKNMPDIAHVAECILSHHETYDGNGYPRELSGEDIPLPARIIHLLCAYEVMTGWRLYGPVFSKEEALEEIASHAGGQFDPRLADLFIRMQNSA